MSYFTGSDGVDRVADGTGRVCVVRSLGRLLFGVGTWSSVCVEDVSRTPHPTLKGTTP